MTPNESVSEYVIQKAPKSHCPECMQPLDLLVLSRGEITNVSHPAFYICMRCGLVFQVAVGPVRREPIDEERDGGA